MPSSYLVYKISNTVNDRLYVGLTTGSLQKRWREHKCAANFNTDKPLYRAMQKHGVEKFKIELLYTATSFEDMREAEMRFIKDLKTHVNDGGYNLTDHGIQHGEIGRPRGEESFRAKLTEKMVAFIRDPAHWDKSNAELLAIIKDTFGFDGSRDAVRDARRGDVWKHLNEQYPPVKTSQGARQPRRTEAQQTKCRALLAEHHAQAIKLAALQRKGKRGANAKLSEDAVRQIFYCPKSLKATAENHGVSKKMVLLIKQRKAHVYLTKDL